MCIYFATTCTVFSLSAIAFTQPSQAIPQLRLTKPTILSTNVQEITDNLQLINQPYNTACPNNQPRSCSPGGSR